MKRMLAALISVLVIGTAAAQPPVDYTLMCDDVIIGTASYADGELHVAVLAGVTCQGELSVAEDPALMVEFVIDADGILTVTIGGMEGEPLIGEAIEVPQQAIDGMVGAARNRTAAAERRGHGQETAAAMRERHQPERPERPDQPERPERPDLPERPERPDQPERPERPDLPDLPELPVPGVPELPVVPLEPEPFGQPELPVVPDLPEAAGGRRP